MKRLLQGTIFLLAFLLTAATLSAQDFPYQVTTFSETYTPIANGTSVNNGQVWDDPEYNIPLGFDFDIFDQTTNELYWVGAVGAIMTAQSYYEPGSALVLYGSDIVDRGLFSGGPSQSPIVYEVTGTAPNRIFKLEYQNAGFYAEDPSISSVNFQMWLYETSNIIEYRFGPSEILSPVHDYGGPLIGLITDLDVNNYQGTFYVLYGPSGDPSIDEVDLDGYPNFDNVLQDDPADGHVFRFTPAEAITVTLNVDMSEVDVVSPDGVHVAGNFQGWDPGATLMTDNGDGTWSHSFTALAGDELLYKFVNGNTWTDAEANLTLDCGVDDGFGGINRQLITSDSDTSTINYCFDYCVECENIPTSLDEISLDAGLDLFPNPASDVLQVRISLPVLSENLEFALYDARGTQLYGQQLGRTQQYQMELNVSDLTPGLYLLQLRDGTEQITRKVIIE